MTAIGRDGERGACIWRMCTRMLCDEVVHYIEGMFICIMLCT